MNLIEPIPDHPTAPSRTQHIVAALVLACVANLLNAEEPGNRFKKQLDPVDPAPAGEWWKASWREGWTYQHRGDFTLSARAKITNKDDVSLWKKPLGDIASDYVGELNLEVRGNSLAESGVLQNENDEILLTRYYPRTDVTRAIFRKPVGDPTGLDKVLNSITDGEKRRPLIKTIMRSIFGFGVGAGGPIVGLPPTTTGFVGGVIGDWIGGQADDMIRAKLKEHGIQVRDDGGIEIDPNSSLLQSAETTKIFADIANLAMQLNDAFNSRAFMISASGKSGAELDTRQIFSEGNDLVAFIEKAESEGLANALGWLKSRLSGYNQPDDLVRGVFQRETFALSSKIFDAQERKSGDVWVVSGEFFNSFLHPDLQGNFRGNVVLRYVHDAKVPDRYDKNVVFNARVIEILYRGTVDGRIQQSTLEYVEPSFSAKLREDTEGVLFVDKADGYLRQANLIMDSEGRSNLPEMKILKGFEAQGNAQFEVIYTSTGFPTEQAE